MGRSSDDARRDSGDSRQNDELRARRLHLGDLRGVGRVGQLIGRLGDVVQRGIAAHGLVIAGEAILTIGVVLRDDAHLGIRHAELSGHFGRIFEAILDLQAIGRPNQNHVLLARQDRIQRGG